MKLAGEDNAYTRLVDQRIQKVPLEEIEGRADCAAIRMRACKEFSVIQRGFHDSFTEQIKYGSEVDARDFFIHKAVNEVFKASSATLSWCGQIQEMESNKEDSGSLYIKATIEAIHNQQNLTVRKLFEVLLFCVLFSNSNEIVYYRHLLLLLDLDQHLSKIQDSTEFFEKVSFFQQQQADEIRKQIIDMESADPRLIDAWYLSKNDQKSRLQKTGRIIVSSRELYKRVRRQADLQLRTTLGHSFEVVFGSSSRWVHFMPSRIYSAGPVTMHDVVAFLAQQALMEEAILAACMDLSNLVPGEFCQAIKNTSQIDPEFITKATERILLRQFSTGYYVLCINTLLKVIEIHESQYGLISCLVKPLAGFLKEQDWLPSSMLTLFVQSTVESPIDDAMAVDLWRAAISADVAQPHQ